MTIKEILISTAAFLGRSDIIDYLDKGVTVNNEQCEKEVKMMVRCANLVINELALEYLPLKFIETAESNGGIIYFGSLSKNILQVLNIFDEYDNKISYKLHADYVKTKPERVKIEYTYIPDTYAIDDVIGYAEKDLPLRAIGYGVASEFSIISGLYDEGVMWDKRYKDSLSNLVFPKSVTAKKRNWLF